MFNNQDDIKQYTLNKLKETDYAMLSDVYILNKSEFIQYRSFLRQVLKDLYLSTQFPETPEPIWGDVATPRVNSQVDTPGIITL